MDAMTKVRNDLDGVIEQAEAMTRADNFDPADPGYVALKEQAEKLERSYKSMAEWAGRKAESDKIGNALHRIEDARKAKDELKTREDAGSLSLGEQFIRSAVYTGYPMGGTTARTSLKLTRALPTDLTDWAAALPPKPRRDITPEYPDTPLLELIPSIPVSGNSVEAIVYAKLTGDVAIVAEGAAKPLLEFKPTVTAVNLENIAGATQLTRQLLEDAPAVRARVDSMLASEIRKKQEAEAAAALVAATLPTASVPVGGSLLAAIRVGVATVQVAGYTPNAVLLNPADWADLDLDVFSSTLGGPTIGQRFWGLTPVAHPAQAAGTATVGDFSAGTERYTRTGINAYITDSHADTFLSNVFTILAEARSKTVVVRPAALVECSVAAAGTASAPQQQQTKK